MLCTEHMLSCCGVKLISRTAQPRTNQGGGHWVWRQFSWAPRLPSRTVSRLAAVLVPDTWQFSNSDFCCKHVSRLFLSFYPVWLLSSHLATLERDSFPNLEQRFWVVFPVTSLCLMFCIPQITVFSQCMQRTPVFCAFFFFLNQHFLLDLEFSGGNVLFHKLDFWGIKYASNIARTLS